MPKENTHLYFADQVCHDLKDEEVRKLIKAALDHYYLGCISPDSFYYGKDRSVKQAAEFIHGRRGETTNEIIFEMLENAKQYRNQKELVFVFGYVTHCVLDIVFHPVITYLVGRSDHGSPKSKEADYKHRYWETHLDVLLGNKRCLNRCISKQIFNAVEYYQVAGRKYGVPRAKLLKAAKRQHFIHRLLRSRCAYGLALLMEKCRLIEYEDLALFYPRLKTREMLIPDRIICRDIITGEERVVLLENLFAQARQLARQRIKAAYDFYYNRISKDECAMIIIGESLETGKFGYAVDQVRYTLDR